VTPVEAQSTPQSTLSPAPARWQRRSRRSSHQSVSRELRLQGLHHDPHYSDPRRPAARFTQLMTTRPTQPLPRGETGQHEARTHPKQEHPNLELGTAGHQSRSAREAGSGASRAIVRRAFPCGSGVTSPSQIAIARSRTDTPEMRPAAKRSSGERDDPDQRIRRRDRNGVAGGCRRQTAVGAAGRNPDRLRALLDREVRPERSA
jgi:hypothetical protein